MKKVMLFTLVLFTFSCVFSQKRSNNNPYLKNGFFSTTLKSGIGQEISISFSINSETVQKIQNLKLYSEWTKETFNDPENKKYLQKHKGMSHIELFLMGEIIMASYYAKSELNNDTSYLPIKGNDGFIYVDDNGKVNFSFPFKAQNGYGNMIFSRAYYSVVWDDEKNERIEEHFIK